MSDLGRAAHGLPNHHPRRRTRDRVMSFLSIGRLRIRARHNLSSLPRPIADRNRALLAAALFALLLEWPACLGHAQERGDAVRRVQTIGFTVADVDREAAFFTKVLQFEKTADFRLVGSAYGTL